MKKLKKTLVLFFALCFGFSDANADKIDKYISETKFDLKPTLGICILDKDAIEVVYQKNEDKLLSPASTLKVLTFGTVYRILGEDYKFRTTLYKDSSNNLYVKLAGDTLLTSKDLIRLFIKAKGMVDLSKINDIFIDGSIFDEVPYPSSWMEEDTWPYQRAITPYIVDNNYVTVDLKFQNSSERIKIIQRKDSPLLPIVNGLAAGNEQNIKIKKAYLQNSPAVYLKGTVAKNEAKCIPVLDPKANFKLKVQAALNKAGVEYSGTIKIKKTPKDISELSWVEHSIKDISKNILHKSDNFDAEVIFKAGAAKYINYLRSATLDDAIKMFNAFYRGVLEEGVRIADGSGVSRYNLVNVRFAIKALLYLSSTTDILNLLACPGEGTLKNRMLALKNDLKAKTGTLSRISSILGILRTQKKNNLLFFIIIQNSPKPENESKELEDQLLNIFSKKY